MLKVREGNVGRVMTIVQQRDRITFDDAGDDLLNDYRTETARSATPRSTGSHASKNVSRLAA